jgi:hypothetical protein
MFAHTKMSRKIRVLIACSLTTSFIACGDAQQETSSTSAAQGSCHSRKAICESEAQALYPANALDENYNQKLRAYIAKSQQCARIVCENSGFKF